MERTAILEVFTAAEVRNIMTAVPAGQRESMKKQIYFSIQIFLNNLKKKI
jgi:galactose-1-phosphate uridylyltransferase